jgi:hypothetical protein
MDLEKCSTDSEQVTEKIVQIKKRGNKAGSVRGPYKKKPKTN